MIIHVLVGGAHNHTMVDENSPVVGYAGELLERRIEGSVHRRWIEGLIVSHFSRLSGLTISGDEVCWQDVCRRA